MIDHRLLVLALSLLTLVSTACNKESDSPKVRCERYDFATRDCESIDDDTAEKYLSALTGKWYLSVSQCGFCPADALACKTYGSVAESPSWFEVQAKDSLYIQSVDSVVDTVTYTLSNNGAAWILTDVEGETSIYLPTDKCGGTLLRDDRPVDGSLQVWSSAPE